MNLKALIRPPEPQRSGGATHGAPTATAGAGDSTQPGRLQP